LQFIFLCIVQGITEFLPKSSSGHLYIFKKILNLGQDLLPFFVFLHLATLFAIFIFLRREILAVLFKRNVLIQIGVITCITCLLGWLIDYYLSSFFGSKYLIFFCLLLNGFILLGIKRDSQTRSLDSITLNDSLLFGILQGLAVFPGISRSGITIVGLLRRGFKPKEAFSLSFLMAIPAIVGAFLFKLKELSNLSIAFFLMAEGFVTAFVFGLLALHLVKKALINKKFKNFAYYCLILALLTLIV